MRTLGMISGTSFDGIDYFVGDFTLQGDAVEIRRIGSGSIPYSDALHTRLAAALPPNPITAEDVCVIDTLVGQEFAAVAQSVIAEMGPVELIVSHGQTFYHWIDAAGRALGTLQVGNPAWIAERTGTTVVSDVRSRDVAAGGQGAPLVSILDVLLLSAANQRQGAVNLGGISNITVVTPDGASVAYDIGPANAMLDAVVAAATNGAQSFDLNGATARSGKVDTALLERFLSDPYYGMKYPKSTGKELFNLAYVEHIAGPVTSARLPDLLATLTELTCQTVMNEVREWQLDRVLFAGGGTENPFMMERMRALAGSTVVDTMHVLDVDPREKEPLVFALMGFFTMHGLPANVPSCTGASGTRILGSITPGACPLVLPQVNSASVRSARMIS